MAGIDRNLRQVALASGETIGYDKLLLTTGAEPVRLPVPGADANGVMYLRTVDDSDRLRQTLASASRIAVVGAGWIGLEVAAAARNAGVAVTVIEAAELPLLGVLGPEAATIFLDLHREHDVDFRPNAQVSEIQVSADGATGVRLADGTAIAADAVIVGIGVRPRTGLAAAAGLDVRDGIVTDAALRTSDPAVFAAGDAALAYHPLFGTHLRVEHWSNARHQPVAAARSMLGQEVVYDRLPYFFSDQYDLGMEYTGYVPQGGYDRVVFRGDVGKRELIAFWLSAGRVLAGMNVNVWDVTDQIGQLILGGGPSIPAASPIRAFRCPRRPPGPEQILRAERAQRPSRCAVRSRCSLMIVDAAAASRRRTASMNFPCSWVPRMPISGAASLARCNDLSSGPRND